MNTWTHPGAGLEPSRMLRLFLAFVFLSPPACLYLLLGCGLAFLRIHCQCPWQTVASRWPQTDFCHVLPPSLGCLGLHLNSRVLRGECYQPRGQGPTPWSVPMLASMALVAPWEGCLERRDAEHTRPHPLAKVLWQVPRALSGDDGC